MDALIEADGLTKKFGKVQALSDLTLTLPARPAGGHPRSQRCRQDHLHPHGGDAASSPTAARCASAATTWSATPMAVRRMIGLAGQSAAVEEMMTGRENLVMVARLYGQSGRAAKTERRADPRA